MAKVQPITTSATSVNAINTTYSEANKITFPFEASRVEVSVVAASGNPLLWLSFDGVNDAALLHHDKASGAGSHTFQLQRITTLYYRQTGTSCEFVVNAERQAWPNPF
jgi:hypothetical protein